MSQKHRNQIVPVFKPWAGVDDRAAYFTTEGKAVRMVEMQRAILRDHEKGVLGGIERVAPSGNLKYCSRIEAHAVREAFVANDSESEPVSLFELAQFFRSRSPYRWAQQDHVNMKTKSYSQKIWRLGFSGRCRANARKRR